MSYATIASTLGNAAKDFGDLINKTIDADSAAGNSNSVELRFTLQQQSPGSTGNTIP